MNAPGETPKARREEEGKEALGQAQTRVYRAATARMNYLALNRSDLRYASKEVCRTKACPTSGDRRALQRAAQFLVDRPGAVAFFKFQPR